MQYDLLVVDNYIKNINTVNADDVQSAYFPQSKFYLKILSILYFIEGTNTSIDASVMETVIKTMHVFNNIHITSKLRVVKMSSKSDIVIVWIDIWNSQSGSSAKSLINTCFNVGSHIATICRANMNLGTPQCKSY